MQMNLFIAGLLAAGLMLALIELWHIWPAALLALTAGAVLGLLLPRLPVVRAALLLVVQWGLYLALSTTGMTDSTNLCFVVVATAQVLWMTGPHNFRRRAGRLLSRLRTRLNHNRAIPTGA